MAVSVQAEAHLLGDDFVEATERALAAGQPGQVSDAELERVMTAAVRLYAAIERHADRRGGDGERSHPRGGIESLGPVDVVQ